MVVIRVLTSLLNHTNTRVTMFQGTLGSSYGVEVLLERMHMAHSIRTHAHPQTQIQTLHTLNHRYRARK